MLHESPVRKTPANPDFRVLQSGCSNHSIAIEAMYRERRATDFKLDSRVQAQTKAD